MTDPLTATPPMARARRAFTRFRSLPARASRWWAHVTLLVASTRARRALRLGVRRLIAAALELAGLAAAVWGMWDIASWIGKLTLAGVLIFTALELEPRRRRPGADT